MERTEVNGLKVTIYLRSENSFFGGIKRVEARLYSYGTREYAQYDNAAFVEFVEKGCRKHGVFIGAHQPYILVLKGWGKWPSPPDMFEAPVQEGSVSVRKMKYTSHDDRWTTDFEKILGTVSPADVVVDFRGHDSSERKYT